MLSLNVLVVTGGKLRGNYTNSILSSKFLNKFYIASEEEAEGAISVNFNTFHELAEKCKALKIDMVLVEDERWILEGIGNVMKLNHINCFVVPSNWTDLRLSNRFAKGLMIKYGISVPEELSFPSEFPVVVKGDGIFELANSLPEIVKIKKNVFEKSLERGKTLVIEKYLKNEMHNVCSLFDGKHLLTFYTDKLDVKLQQEYSKRLENMFISEHADFIGFINSKLIEEDGLLYNTGFSLEFNLPDFSCIKSEHDKDILYICNSALYQKLDEIELKY